MLYDVLIIGAGLSGLKAAGDLHAAGRSVLLLDKGRGVGGRAATRRWDSARVDHGAQFFTARSDEFRAQAEDWLTRGVCFRWCDGFSQWDDDGQGLRPPDPADTKHPRYACQAGMSALGKDLASRLPEAAVRLKSRAVKLKRLEDHWQVELEAGDTDEPPAGKCLILALPAPQALALLKDSALLDGIDPSVRQKLEAVEYAPTLAVMLRGTATKPDWKGIQLRDKTLSWISDDTSKRSENNRGDAEATRIFVLHGSPEFSREWQDADLEKAADRMVARAGELVGDWITHLPERQIHRWRFANVPCGVDDAPYLQDGGREGVPTLYICGDAFLKAKIEGAYCSGLQVARELLSDSKPR